jgi:GTP cyclohydrolase I
MKQNGTSLNTRSIDNFDVEEIGDEHLFSSIETPMRPDAFALEDDVKIELIEKHFRHIMEIMGLDLTDDSLKGTPKRVAKMYIKEVFSGLDPKNKPAVSLFDNKYKYDQMLVEKDISVFSNCEHHFVPIYGKAHIAYISSGKVIGLSKLNRIVDYFSKRPQVQERLTVQIATELKQALNTEDVAVVIDAKHMCVQSRGIRDTGSSTVTAYYGGKFEEEATKKEFLTYLGM